MTLQKPGFVNTKWRAPRDLKYPPPLSQLYNFQMFWLDLLIQNGALQETLT